MASVLPIVGIGGGRRLRRSPWVGSFFTRKLTQVGQLSLCAALAGLPAFAGNAADSVFGLPPAVDHVRVSPNGERVLAIASGAGKRGLAVIDLSAGSTTVALRLKPSTEFLDACEWISNERIVCSMFVFRESVRDDVDADSARVAAPYPRRRLVRLIAVGHDGGNPLALLDRPPKTPPKLGGVLSATRARYDDLEHELVHPLLDDPAHVLVAAPREASPYRSVYRINVYDGSATRLVGWKAGIVFWRADGAGRIRVGTGWYEFGNLPPVREPWIGPTAVAADATGEFQRIDVAALSERIGEQEFAGPRILGFSADGTRLYYEARVRGADRSAVWEADAATLKPLRRLVSDAERDVHASAIGGRDCGVVGFMHPLPGRPFTWLDTDFGRAVAAAADGEPDDFVAVTSMSADCRRLVLAATDQRARRGFYLLDRATGALRHLGEQYPTTAESRRTQRRTVHYATRDGLDLPMALTTPRANGGPRPVVVLLDSGVARQSVAPLDTWPHFFASRGYVVAQPAFRGMKGYGAAFHLAGLRDYGAKLQEDVADAIAWLGATRLGDTDRVCFLGRGRGGHFALAAALSDSRDDGQTAGRCAAAYAALDMALTKRTEHNPFDGRVCAHFQCGDWMRWAAPGAVSRLSRTMSTAPNMRRSPLVGAAHPGFPVLIHSSGRSVVHENGSKRFRKDLKKLGFFEQIAPVGSEDEATFLGAAEGLFRQVLHRAEPPLASDSAARGEYQPAVGERSN